MKSKMKLRMDAIGITAAQMAHRLGTHSTNIYALAAGRTIPSLLLAQKVAQVLGCRACDCFDTYSVGAVLMTPADMRQFAGGIDEQVCTG